MAWGPRVRVGLDIAPDALTLVRVHGRGRRAVLVDHRVQPLAPGVLTVSPVEKNIVNPEAFGRALAALCDKSRVSVCAVSLPDSVARATLFDTVTLPAKADELDRLIRWHLEKAFALDLPSSALVHQTFPRTDGQPGPRVLAMGVEQAILAQYEDALADVGLEPRVIGLATFHRFNAHRSSMTRLAHPGQQFILLAITMAGLTILIFEGGVLGYVRIKGTRRPLTGGEATDRVLEEVEVSLNAYGKEKDLSQITHLFLSAIDPADDLPQRLEERLHLAVKALGAKDVGLQRIAALSDLEVARAAAALGAAMEG